MGILRRHFADWGDFGGYSGRYSPAGYEIGCRRGHGGGQVEGAPGCGQLRAMQFLTTRDPRFWVVSGGGFGGQFCAVRRGGRMGGFWRKPE